MSKLNMLKKLTTRSVFGAGIGYLSSRTTSSSAESEVNAKMGMRVGALGGAMTVIAPKVGKIIFKRIKGRIVPIMKK